MKKRGNDNSQMRREEVDALEGDEGEEAGVFARASAEELSKRKIIRSTRNFPPSTAPVSAPAPTFLAAAPVAAAASSNPFAAFGTGLLTGASSIPPTAQVTATAPVNPFQGFTGITGFVSKPETKPDSGLPYSAVRDGGISSASSTAGVAATAAKGLGVPSGATQDDTHSDEYTRKMKKLNQSIATWMDKQMVEQPLSIWKDGLAVS
jgi:hypothetical protein